MSIVPSVAAPQIPTSDPPADQPPHLRIADPDGGEPPTDASPPGKVQVDSRDTEYEPDERAAVVEGPLFAPDDPRLLADKYLKMVSAASNVNRLRSWRDSFWRWESGRYVPVTDAEMKHLLAEFIDEEFLQQNIREVALWHELRARGEQKTENPPVKRKATQRIVSDVRMNLASLAIVPERAPSSARSRNWSGGRMWCRRRWVTWASSSGPRR